MKFFELFNFYLDRSGLSKTELSNQLRISVQYVTKIGKEGSKPPSFERIDQLIKIFKLTAAEGEGFKETAFNEKFSKQLKNKKVSDFLLVREKQPIYAPPNVLEALNDPIAVKALLITHKNSQDIKKTIESLLEYLPNLSMEKRQAILALCK